MINHAIDGLECVVVLFHHVADVLHAGVLAHPMADVAGVAQGAGKVAFKDFRCEILRVPAAHRLDEVAEVIAAALEFFD